VTEEQGKQSDANWCRCGGVLLAFSSSGSRRRGPWLGLLRLHSGGGVAVHTRAPLDDLVFRTTALVPPACAAPAPPGEQHRLPLPPLLSSSYSSSFLAVKWGKSPRAAAAGKRLGIGWGSYRWPARICPGDGRRAAFLGGVASIRARQRTRGRRPWACFGAAWRLLCPKTRDTGERC
jgi:hypothetical protein